MIALNASIQDEADGKIEDVDGAQPAYIDAYGDQSVNPCVEQHCS
jgi:hypothetical protein